MYFLDISISFGWRGRDRERRGKHRCVRDVNLLRLRQLQDSGRNKMAEQVDTLGLLAQPELTENQTARKSDTKEIENKHSSRPVGGVETGTGAERTRVAVAGPRLVECGMNGAGSLTTSRPCSPTFAQINREGGTQSGGEWGRQSGGQHPVTHTPEQINWEEGREAKQTL